MTQRPRCGHHLQSKVLRFDLCSRKDLIQPSPSPRVLVESENRSLYKHGQFSLFPITFFSKAQLVLRHQQRSFHFDLVASEDKSLMGDDASELVEALDDETSIASGTSTSSASQMSRTKCILRYWQYEQD